MSSVIQAGSRVTLHYSLALQDGTPVDSTRDTGPVTIVMRNGEMVEFLEERLLGLHAGERRHFELGGSETQVPVDLESVQHLSRADFPAGLEPVVGEVIGFETPQGQEVAGLVLSVTENEVLLDFSHPLAGRDLVFDVEIIAVEPA